MNKVNIKINGMPLTVESGTRIIDAAKLLHIDIPHLCYHPDQRIKALCRICSVEVVGSRKMMAACATQVWDGMEIWTNTKKVYETQKTILELLLANHNQDCLHCPRNGSCELQALCARFHIDRQVLPETIDEAREDWNPSLVRDASKCIKCGRCDKICRDVQGVAALTWAGRSKNFEFTTAYHKPLLESDCVLCGQCSTVCPTGAITEHDDTEKVWAAIQDPQKHVVVQVAPAVRVAIGDAFGLAAGAVSTGKLITALKRLGVDKVFDTAFSADVTIWEEGSELLHRLQNNGTLPMLTSCCPGWVNYVEKHHDALLEHLSTTRSPQQIFGAVAKSYYAEKNNIAKEDLVTISVMPCVAKKYEAAQPEMARSGFRDVDIVITTRELARMFTKLGLQFADLPESDFDEPLGESTGAGVIFGTTGGVMEAALRMAYEKVTGREILRVDFAPLEENEDIRTAELDLGKRKIRAAVASGLANAQKLIEKIETGESPYDFIEIMACPGGCIGGGGQPRAFKEVRQKRMDALHLIDEKKEARKPQENKSVQKLYTEYVGQPLGEKAHELFHTERMTIKKSICTQSE